MTNGEKIQTILDVDKDCTEVHGENGTMTFTVTQDFWNAEYKEPRKALEQEPTTKNDLGADCISRAEAIKCLECDFDITGKENMKTVVNYINSAHDKIANLPRVKQEPIKPMVEIDLYSVIKQKYIEREVLDKIRAEIAELIHYYPMGHDYELAINRCIAVIDKCKANSQDFWLRTPDEIKNDILTIIDKYKAENEPQKSEE